VLSVAEADIGIIGLGYVGLPLAVAFGKLLPTVGTDIHSGRICYRWKLPAQAWAGISSRVMWLFLNRPSTPVSPRTCVCRLFSRYPVLRSIRISLSVKARSESIPGTGNTGLAAL